MEQTAWGMLLRVTPHARKTIDAAVATFCEHRDFDSSTHLFFTPSMELRSATAATLDVGVREDSSGGLLGRTAC
jgi:hypothetical protein